MSITPAVVLNTAVTAISLILPEPAINLVFKAKINTVSGFLPAAAVLPGWVYVKFIYDSFSVAASLIILPATFTVSTAVFCFVSGYNFASCYSGKTIGATGDFREYGYGRYYFSSQAPFRQQPPPSRAYSRPLYGSIAEY